MGLLGAGDHEQAGRAPVEAVDDARTGRVRADAGESGVEGQQPVDQGRLVGPRAGMDDQAGGLVHHVEVLVGVDQGHHDAGVGLDRGLDRRLVVDHDDGVVGHPVRPAGARPARRPVTAPASTSSWAIARLQPASAATRRSRRWSAEAISRRRAARRRAPGPSASASVISVSR